MASRQDVLLRGQPEPESGLITHGIQLTSSNTGVPGDVTLTPQVTDGGTVQGAFDYVSKEFPNPTPDSFYQLNNGVATFTNCLFGDGLGVDTANDVDFINCEFNGGLSISTSARVTFTDCRFYNPGGDHLHITGDSPAGTFCDDVTLTRCLFDGIIPGNVQEGAHLDGLQTRGARRLLLDRCAWRMGDQWDHFGDPLPINAAVFFENANGDSGTGGAGSVDIEMIDCYLDGGTQTLFLQPFTGYLKVSGCRWGPRNTGQRVRNDSAVTPTVWTNNVLDSDDTPIPYDGSV
jgi:hypothetical protein